jgi:hypothetical protein
MCLMQLDYTLSVDIGLRDRKIAIELQGDGHFFQHVHAGGSEASLEPASSLRYNGATEFKARILRSLGWNTVHVSSREWQALKSHEAKSEYIRHKFGRYLGINIVEARVDFSAPVVVPGSDETPSMSAAATQIGC